MSVQGRRIHISGSAATDADEELLAAAHELVRHMTRRLVAAGAGVVAGVGAEPLANCGLACTFDWTILDVISDAEDPAPNWPAQQGGRFRVVASERGIEKIPADRIETWARCTARSDFEIDVIPAGWRMGGVIRARQVLLGDVLIVLGAALASSSFLSTITMKAGA